MEKHTRGYGELDLVDEEIPEPTHEMSGQEPLK